MAYMYMICKKDDLAQGYIGQARGDKDALDRIYQHIAGSYHIPHKVHYSWKEDQYQWQNESSQFLLDEIATTGACNFQYLINSNSRTCYGVGAKSYNEFRKYWTIKKLGGRGMGDASEEEAEKLDFAEFVYIYKYRNQLGGTQRAGSQSAFYYLTAPLIKQIKKVQNKNKQLQDTWADLIKTLEDINEKVAWSSQKVSDADKILENEKDLLYPESKVLGYAFEKSMINFIMSPDQVMSIIKQAAASPEMLTKIGKDSEAVLKKIFKNTKYSFVGVKTAEQSLTTVILSKMKDYVNENKKKWEQVFSLLGFGNCTINISDEVIKTKANQLKNTIKKIKVSTTESTETHTIDWTFDKDSITITLTNQPEPTWYSDAEDFLHGFNKDVTDAVRAVCINNYKALYQDYIAGKPNPADAFKILFQKAPFIINNWYLFFDPIMNSLQEVESGPLVFENFKKDPTKYKFGRADLINYFGDLIYLDVVPEDEMSEMLRYTDITIW